MSEAWQREINKAWMNPALRREFEDVTGLAPLARGFQTERREKQVTCSHAFAYEHAFKAWITKKLGIFSKAPEELQDLCFKEVVVFKASARSANSAA